MIDRDEILRNIPIDRYLEDRGVTLRRSGGKLVTESCPICQNHKKGHLCVTVDVEKGLFNCNDAGKGGSVIDWEMYATGKTPGEILKEWSARFAPPETVKSDALEGKEIETTYDYTDENDVLLYQQVRFKPKDFRPRRPVTDGWAWNLEGITRVPYKLGDVIRAKTVAVVEGEKDADNVSKLGITATTSMGANSWLGAYGDFLKGKDVIIIPDNDKAGSVFAESVYNSVKDKANSIRKVVLPDGHKDVSDFLQAGGDLQKLIDQTVHALEPVPIYSMIELEDRYREYVRRVTPKCNMTKFAPGLSPVTNALMPGEMILVVGGPGDGKSTVVTNMALSASPAPTVLFSLELDWRRMFERIMQSSLGCREYDVVRDYKENDDSYCKDIMGLHHVYICDESGISLDVIEEWINRIELKIGERPQNIVVDYVQLLANNARSERYEHMSNVAEKLRVIARRTETKMVIASQRSRPDPKAKDKSVHLFSPKDSGSLENSSTLVLGLDRISADILDIKVLKNNNGPKDFTVQCRFNGSLMQIEEIEKIAA